MVTLKLNFINSSSQFSCRPKNICQKCFSIFKNSTLSRPPCLQSPWDRFHQHFTSSFCTRRSKKNKKTVKLSVSFYAFGICTHKSCMLVKLLLVSISSMLNLQIFRTNVVFLVTFWLCQKICTKNLHV